MSTADDITRECAAIRDLLLAKNLAYGDSAFDPVRIFSQADPVEQIRVRIDDKLSRLGRGKAAGEDVEQDLLGYLVLLRIARKRATPSLETPPPSSKLQPGDVVPWAEVQAGANGCLFHKEHGYAFVMMWEGKVSAVDGPDAFDIEGLLHHGYACVPNPAAVLTLVARDLGSDPEAWKQAMRAHLAHRGIADRSVGSPTWL